MTPPEIRPSELSSVRRFLTSIRDEEREGYLARARRVRETPLRDRLRRIEPRSARSAAPRPAGSEGGDN